MQLSAKTLRTAASVAEKIEALQHQLGNLLGKDFKTPTRPQRRAPTVRKRSRPRNREKVATARGTLTPAVHQVLADGKGPLKAADIYEALLAKGYKFTSAEPRKVLGIRLYKMAGVQALGNGLFKLTGR